jgi:hypothetical protein
MIMPRKTRPAPDPAAGEHHLVFERRFRFLRPKPFGEEWDPKVLACPACEGDTGLELALNERAGLLVQAVCPCRHQWLEPAVDRTHFATYSRLRYYADPDPTLLWIVDAGFGEEPPPIDPKEIVRVAKAIGRVYKGQAKRRVRAAVRKPVRAARRKAANAATRPFTAAVRAVRGRRSKQAGEGTEPTSAVPPLDVKIPSVAKYRKAYGMPAPKRGPKCLVCQDSGHITAPGISIPCTECDRTAGTAAPSGRRRTVAKPQAAPRPGGGTAGTSASGARAATRTAATTATTAEAARTRRADPAGARNVRRDADTTSSAKKPKPTTD